jgi:hypothetical protein
VVFIEERLPWYSRRATPYNEVEKKKGKEKFDKFVLHENRVCCHLHNEATTLISQ